MSYVYTEISVPGVVVLENLMKSEHCKIKYGSVTVAVPSGAAVLLCCCDLSSLSLIFAQ